MAPPLFAFFHCALETFHDVSSLRILDFAYSLVYCSLRAVSSSVHTVSHRQDSNTGDAGNGTTVECLGCHDTVLFDDNCLFAIQHVSAMSR